jgi:hypothetical protein
MNTNKPKNIQQYIKYHKKSKSGLNMIFNVLLVYNKARDAYFNEHLNNEDVNDFIGYLNSLNNNIKLIILKNVSGIFEFITLYNSNTHLYIKSGKPITDKQVGIFLGFQCPGLDKDGPLNPRIMINYEIYQLNVKMKIINELIAEVCPENQPINIIEQNCINKSKLFTNILKEYGYGCKYNIRIDDGHEIRYKNLKDMNIKYINKNVDEYINDFLNYYIINHNSFMKTKTYKLLTKQDKRDKDILIIASIYKTVIIDDIFREYYDVIGKHLNLGNESEEMAACLPLVEYDKKFWVLGLGD